MTLIQSGGTVVLYGSETWHLNSQENKKIMLDFLERKMIFGPCRYY